MSSAAAPQDLCSQIRDRYQRMPSEEKAQLIQILHQLTDLDEQLADLHIFLPVVDITFYGLGTETIRSATISPDKLLELIRLEAPQG